MKFLKHLLRLSIILCLFSCSKQEAVLEVNTFKEIVISPGLSTIEAHYYRVQDVPILFETQVSSSGIPMEDVSSFVPGKATLLPDNGRNIDLSFIRSVNVFLIDPNDSEKRYEIFYQDLVNPGEKTEIRLLNNITDFKEILENDRAQIETRFEFYTPPPSTSELRLNMSFSVFTSE